MSWKKYVTLWCDGEGCNEWVKCGESQVGKTREWAAEKRGWVFRNAKDLCPDCQ